MPRREPPIHRQVTERACSGTKGGQLVARSCQRRSKIRTCDRAAASCAESATATRRSETMTSARGGSGAADARWSK